MISIERMDLARVPWDLADRFEDRNVFQKLPWIRFVAASQGAEPVVAEVKSNGRVIGYFTGLIVRRYGFRILGSPFRGWTTEYMGFNLEPGISRKEVLAPLFDFAFNDLSCHHLEMVDRNLREEDYREVRCQIQQFPGYEIDLTKSEDELLANMTKSCRYSIRKAAKSGVTIEQASDNDGFDEDYYGQLIDVFAKQSLVPTYSIDRVRELIRHLYPAGSLLLLRARNATGECIATGIFPGFNDTMYGWGGACWRAHYKLRPNEILAWHAMRYWKSRGMKKFDLGGRGEYKKKYGTYDISVPGIVKSRYPMLVPLRNAAERAWRFRQAVAGRIKGTPSAASTPVGAQARSAGK